MAATMTLVATTVAWLTITTITGLPMVKLNASGDAQIAGEDYTLTCTVTGGGTVTPTYRWWKSGTLLTDQTANTIAFRPLQQTSSGVYICEGTRNFIAVNSSNMTFAVQGESNHRMKVYPNIVS